MSNVELYLLVGFAIVAVSLAAMGDPWKGSRTAFVVATLLAILAWPALIAVAMYHVAQRMGSRSANKP